MIWSIGNPLRATPIFLGSPPRLLLFHNKSHAQQFAIKELQIQLEAVPVEDLVAMLNDCRLDVAAVEECLADGTWITNTTFDRLEQARREFQAKITDGLSSM